MLAVKVDARALVYFSMAVSLQAYFPKLGAQGKGHGGGHCERSPGLASHHTVVWIDTNREREREREREKERKREREKERKREREKERKRESDLSLFLKHAGLAI